MDGYKLLTARFVDNQRITIESQWINDIGDEIIPIVCEASENDTTFRDLLTRMSLDDIHENTYQWINEQQNALKDIAIAKAKKDGLVFDIDGAMNSNIYRAVVRALFQEFDPIEHKEQLFLLKLEMFEQDIIKNCKDRELKRKLRKADTIIGTVKAAIDIFYANQEISSSDTVD
jgi:hypothetical protein